MDTLSGRMIRFIYKVLPLVILFTAVSCVREDVPAPGEVDGEALVRLTIRTPGTSAPRSAATRSGDSEYDIETVKVIVLDRRDDGKYYYRYMVDGQNVTPEEGQKTTFYALLKASPTPVKLLMVANYGDAFSGYAPAAGDPEDAVRGRLASSFAFSPDMKIPMYGEVVRDRLETETSNTISAVMLRALARADVTTELDPLLSKSFELTEAWVYRGRAKVQVAPDLAALTAASTPRVYKPSQFSADTLESYSKTTLDPLSVTGIYLPECETVDGDAARLKGVTCLVVGGLYDGDTSPTYYRVDFNSGIAGHPFGQILRNHRYRIVVKRVTGRGWEDPDDAANNRATTIVTEVKAWEDFTLEMYTSGDDYFGVSSRKIVFPYRAGEEKALHVSSTVDYSIQWLDAAGEPVGEATATAGETLYNDYFSASIVREPGFADDESRVVFTTLTENRTDTDLSARMLVRWGNWKFDVTVTQESYRSHSREVVKVLSAFMGTAGHLGYGTDPTTASGQAMRQVLSNPANFSVNGTVDYFAGFVFNATSNVGAFRDPDGTNAATETLRAMLVATDVLYLGNDNQLSGPAARMVMEWLEADDRRVLIVGADASGTSHNLLRSDGSYLGMLAGDVDYWYGSTHFSTYHYDNKGIGHNKCRLPTEYTAENTPFTRGPFGNVSPGATFTVTDIYYGYTKSRKSSIVPLITHVSDPAYMMVGVDRERRIVYHGDASLFQLETPNYRMSAGAHNNGTINNDLDLIWANTWAWIAHRVIWGDE